MRLLALSLFILLTGCSSTEISPTQQSEERLTPITQYSIPPVLNETSGLVEYQGSLWSINDGGNYPVLHSWSTSSQSDAPRFNEPRMLAGADNFDWESMAQNDQGLFVLDCGNNRGDRIWLQSYFVGWDSLKQKPVSAQKTQFRFGDTDPRVARRDHNNDCEAAAWVEDSLWIFTKNWVDQQTRIYQLGSGQEQVLSAFATLPVGGLVTGADYSAEFEQLVLLGYGKGLSMLQPFVWFIPVNDSAPDWAGAERFLLDRSGQWEAILWRQDRLLLTREDSVLGGAVLAELPVPRHRLKKF